MFGNNKILKPFYNDGKILDIVEIFLTIQGECIYAGTPAIFVRLGGCNLACKFCDTEFDNYKSLNIEKIISKIEILASQNKVKTKLVVITGGEPFRQNISLLCEKLVKNDYLVQIETNGTLFLKLPQEVKIICSPKISGGIYHQIRSDLLKITTAFKFLISDTKTGYNEIPEIGQSIYHQPVYVQPMDEYSDELNKKNIELALKICKDNNYIISLQTHKILNIP